MRSVVIVGLLALFCPAVAAAQSPPAAAPATQGAPPTSPGATAAPKKGGGGDITRDQYIERAKANAEKRFDQLDANHDGVLSAAERRAARTQRGSPAPQ